MLLGLPLNIPKSLPYSFSFFIHINLFFLKKFCPSWVEFSKQLSDNLPKSCKLTSNQFVGSLIYNQNLLVNTKSSEIIINRICKNFENVNKKQMQQFLSILTKFRNVCAHSERLFTYRTRDAISDLPLHHKMSIPKQGIQYQYGKNDLFAVVIAFRYLLPDKDFLIFRKRLIRLINAVSKKLIHLNNPDLLKKMGFPKNWKNITRY